MPIEELDLYKRLEEGVPLTPAQGDQNWTDIETAVNAVIAQGEGITDEDGELLSNVITEDSLQVEALGKGYYVDSSVAANTITITISPTTTLAELVGVPIRIKVANANTGNLQITLKGDGGTTVATTALRHSGTTEIASGYIPAGRVITVIHDSTIWQLQSAGVPASSPPSVTGFVNLVIANKVGTEDAQLLITADEILCRNVAGNYAQSAAVNKTLDMGVQGPGGRRTSLAESAETWYTAWFLIKGDFSATTVVFDSPTVTVPDLANVSGYETAYYCHLGQFYNTAASHLRRVRQYGRKVWMRADDGLLWDAKQAAVADTYELYSGGAGGSDVALTKVVPTQAKVIGGMAGSSNTGDDSMFIIAADGDGMGAHQIQIDVAAAEEDDFAACAPFEIPIVTAQTFYWKSLTTGQRTRVVVTSYQF